MNSKVGMFFVLVLGVMILFISVTSIANAQEYEDRYYGEKDEYIYEKGYYLPKDKKDEIPTLFIKIGLPCDMIANITSTILKQQNIVDSIFGQENEDIDNENRELIDVLNVEKILLEICDSSDFNQQINVESIDERVPVNINQIGDNIDPFYIQLIIDNRAGVNVDINFGN